MSTLLYVLVNNVCPGMNITCYYVNTSRTFILCLWELHIHASNVIYEL